MTCELTIEPDGCLRLSEPAIRLQPEAKLDDVREIFQSLLRSERDYGNGYCWLDLKELTFGGQASGASLGFRDSRLTEVTWNVSLPGRSLEAGWPTRESSEREIAFVRGELARQVGRSLPAGFARFEWGEVWSVFDEKSYAASNGIRWRQSA